MNNKKLIIIALALAVVAGVTLGLVFGLSGGDNSTSNPDSSREIVWVDSSDPDLDAEKDPENTSPKVVYPEKPADEPIVDANAPVIIGNLTVSNECYTLSTDDNGKTKLSYSSEYNLPAYAYVYVPVENYHAKYSYLKINANCTGVQKITIVAVYYEQYDANRPGVTVYNNTVKEGESIILCDLSEPSILDEHYNVAIGEKLTQKKIIGFMIMIDSNPKQVIDDYVGEMLIKSIAVVDETDPDLALLNAAPTISGWSVLEGSYAECEIIQDQNATTGGMDAIIDYAFNSAWPFVTANIYNYKSEYTTLKMKIQGLNVKNLTIAIKYSLTTTSTSVDYNYISAFGMEVPTNLETFEFDFSTLEELTQDFVTTVPGSYIKNLKPTALYFFIDTATEPTGGLGTLIVKDVEFVKTVDDGTPKVTSTWSNIADAGLTKSNVEAGGVGTITYNKTQGWNALTINVSSYNPEYTVLVVKVKFYGAKNLGIALGYGSSNTVIQNSDGNTAASVVLNHTTEEGTDEKGDYVFHTFEIDFSAVTIVGGDGGLLSAQSINKIMFYIDAVQLVGGQYMEVSAGSTIAERTMQFVGIEFKKPTLAEGE